MEGEDGDGEVRLVVAERLGLRRTTDGCAVNSLVAVQAEFQHHV